MSSIREGSPILNQVIPDGPKKSGFRKNLERMTAALALAGTLAGGAHLGSEKTSSQSLQEIKMGDSSRSNDNPSTKPDGGLDRAGLFSNISLGPDADVEDGEDEQDLGESEKAEIAEDDANSKDAAEMFKWLQKTERVKNFKKLMEDKFKDISFDYDSKQARLDLSVTENGRKIEKICRINFYEEDGVKKIDVESVRGIDLSRSFSEDANIEEIYTELLQRKKIFVETQGMNMTQITDYLKKNGVPITDASILVVRRDR